MSKKGSIIAPEVMDGLADSIENYLDLYTSVMIIPKDCRNVSKKQLDEAISTTKKLIKKLRQHKQSVYKDSCFDDEDE